MALDCCYDQDSSKNDNNVHRSTSSNCARNIHDIDPSSTVALLTEEKKDDNDDDEPTTSPSSENKNKTKRKKNEASAAAADEFFDKDDIQEFEEECLESLALQTWPSLQQIQAELRKQAHLGLPIAAMNLMWFARFVICTIFLGHLGGLELAGGTLALTFANVSGYSILMGLSGGMEPFCSQAFGARNFGLMALTLHRGILILLVACIPVGLLWMNVENILVFFGQDQGIAHVAGGYLVLLLPDLAIQSVIHPLRIYLRCQLSTLPMMTCSGIAMVLHLALNFLFVLGLRMGAAGTALAITITDLSMILMLVIYMLRSSSSGNVGNLGCRVSSKCLKRWKPLVKLSIPSCLMTCLEWWCYEIIVLLTGMLKNPQDSLSAAAIVLNCDTIFYALQITLASCACTRIGNELGANSPVAAYIATTTSLVLSFVFGLISSVWMVSAKGFWGRIFTSESGILGLVAMIMPVMGLIELANFPQIVCCGVLRGSARPMAGAVANLGSFYLVGLPVSLILGILLRLGLLGLWIGLLVAVVSCAAMLVLAVLGTDWAEQAACAQRQLRCCWAEEEEEAERHYEDDDHEGGKELDELNKLGCKSCGFVAVDYEHEDYEEEEEDVDTDDEEDTPMSSI